MCGGIDSALWITWDTRPRSCGTLPVVTKRSRSMVYRLILLSLRCHHCNRPSFPVPVNPLCPTTKTRCPAAHLRFHCHSVRSTALRAWAILWFRLCWLLRPVVLYICRPNSTPWFVPMSHFAQYPPLWHPPRSQVLSSSPFHACPPPSSTHKVRPLLQQSSPNSHLHSLPCCPCLRIHFCATIFFFAFVYLLVPTWFVAFVKATFFLGFQ